MADDVVLPGTGDTVRADEVGGKKIQVVKLDFGGDGASIPVVTDLPINLGAGKVAADAFAAGSQVDGHSDTLGLTTDAAAGSSTVEDTTARTGIGLWKGIKNLLKLINDKLVAGTNIGSVTVIPATTGGLTPYRTIDLDETGQLVKAGAGQIYGWYMHNAAKAIRYVKIYNHVNAPVVGDSADIVANIDIPPSSAANVFTSLGIACSAGIGMRATTGVADADTGAPATNDVIVNLYYK